MKIVKNIPFTAVALAELQSKFDRLMEQREQVKKRVSSAREMGDLSENGAYTYGKMELGSLGRQLRYLKRLLDHGYVVEETKHTKAEFGATITVHNSRTEITYTLVGQHEADPTKNKLSVESPIGKALLGKVIGDSVTVQIPAGQVTYTILAIR